MLLGTGKAIITPPIGTELAGYAHRDHGAESVLDDLEVRVVWLQEEDAGQAVCLVTADIVGFGPTLTSDIRQALHTRAGLPPERIMLAASHTHSGPQTCDNMLNAGEMDNDAVMMVRDRILEAVDTARRNLHAVTLRAGRGACEGYAVNRRLPQDGEVLFVANPDGVRDDEVIAIVCHDAETDAVRAALFHFTCHPTLMGDYQITGDYPGVARRHIEQTLGDDAIAAFLPGCFGDIRPACTYVGGTKFRRGMPEDVAIFGRALGEEVIRIVHGDTQSLTPGLNARATALDLPLSPHPSRDALIQKQRTGDAFGRKWASYLLSQPEAPTRPLSLQRIDLTADVTLIVMGGEVCCGYGRFVKGLRRDAFMIPVGYANGLLAYISPARLYDEGGYEPITSCPYFGLPAPFTPEIEGIIQDGIREIMGMDE